MEDDVIRVLFVAPMHVWAKELSVEEVCDPDKYTVNIYINTAQTRIGTARGLAKLVELRQNPGDVNKNVEWRR